MKQALLVVSFGSSVALARREIAAVEQALQSEEPGRDFFQAYTSPTIRRILQREGEQVPGLGEALDNLRVQGYEDVAVAVTHLLYGYEYDRIQQEVQSHRANFRKLVLGRPLAADTESLRELARILPECYPAHGDALVLLGHGTEHPANMMYPALQTVLRLTGRNDVYVGTVEGWPGFEDVLSQLRADGRGSVLLAPFMLVAGDHARNDMAGADPDSWKSRLEAAGFEVRCQMDGLGSMERVRDLYRAHLRSSLEAEEQNGI